jgi:hypothetical protein
VIGRKRNLGCSWAEGAVIVHWDDDDFSAPGRIADQVERLHETGKAVTGYHSMKFTDGERWWQYSGNPSYSLGTSLCFQREWWKSSPFPAVQVGEDNTFVGMANHRRELSSVDAGDMMHATIHPGNTSPRQLSGGWTVLS